MKSMRRILTVMLPVTVLVSSASWAETKLEAFPKSRVNR